MSGCNSALARHICCIGGFLINSATARNLSVAAWPLESGAPVKMGVLPADSRPWLAPPSANPIFHESTPFADAFALVNRPFTSISHVDQVTTTYTRWLRFDNAVYTAAPLIYTHYKRLSC